MPRIELTAWLSNVINLVPWLSAIDICDDSAPYETVARDVELQWLGLIVTIRVATSKSRAAFYSSSVGPFYILRFKCWKRIGDAEVHDGKP